MSDTSVTVVEISVSDSEASRRAVELTGWLLSTGVIERDDRWQLSEFQAGPNVLVAAPDLDDTMPATGEVKVIAKRDFYLPGIFLAAPDCPACQATLDEEAYYVLAEPWLVGPEPQVTCPACQTATLLGDWIAEEDDYGGCAFQVGSLAVVFNN